MKTNCIIRALFALASVALAAVSASADDELVYFWGKKGAYAENQTRTALSLVNDLLDSFPPSAATPPALERRAALQLVDGVLHDAQLDSSLLVADFMDSRMARVLADLDRPLSEGMRIYKLYNAGVIVRTPEVTMAWDIYRGPDRFGPECRRLITDSVAHALADRCHIMFLSHNHPDHVDPGVVDMFVAAGKPVVAPDEILPDNKGVTHVRPAVVERRSFTASNGAEVECTIIPGHQDHLQNNIVIATTPSGLSACQTGDQWLKEDIEWIHGLKGALPKVDVMLPNCWAAQLPDFVDTFSPALTVTVHENELGHTADHREALWLSLYKTARVRRPVAVMTWGEIIDL